MFGGCSSATRICCSSTCVYVTVRGFCPRADATCMGLTVCEYTVSRSGRPWSTVAAVLV